MKKLRKTTCIISMVLMLTATLLSGCGNTSSTQASSSEATSSGTKNLSFYGFSEWVADPKLGPVYKEVVDQFEKENPGFKVDVQSDPWGTWADKYKVMFASGNAADVFYVNNPDFPVFANGDNLLDLSSYVDKSYFSDFFPGVTSMYTWKNKNMAIPFTTDCRVLWYNKELFKKAGLDPNSPPKTWDELKEDAKKLTMDTNGDGKVDVYGFGMDLGLKEFPQQALFTASKGSTIKVGSDGSITPNVNTPEFTKYLQTITDMKPYYEPDYATLDMHKVGTLFAQQKVAMAIAGTWIWDQNKNMATDTFYGQALVPKMDATSPDGSYSGGFGIAVSKNTKYPKEAVKLAQMLCDAKNNSRLMTDIPASNKGLAESSFAKDEKYSTFMKQITSGRQAQPKTLFYPQIDSATYDVVSKVVMGNESVESGIKELDASIKAAAK